MFPADLNISIYVYTSIMVAVKVQRIDRADGSSVHTVLIPSEVILDSGIKKGDLLETRALKKGVVEYRRVE